MHHALCNIIEPIFNKTFIYDSYANRIGKGVLKAINRFKIFSRKVARNYISNAFVLKADIKHYFENVDREILIKIIDGKIKDEKVIWLIKQVLNNFTSKINGRGMPLGNLTSQFFANVYLNELNQFVKHELKAKYYIRYVDDFVILENNKNKLEYCQKEINNFVHINLNLELHPDKSKIIDLYKGVEFLGFKIFPYYSIIKRKNISKFKRKMQNLTSDYSGGKISYDRLFDFIEGWIAYAQYANTYNLRDKILSKFEEIFNYEISAKEVNRILNVYAV